MKTRLTDAQLVAAVADAGALGSLTLLTPPMREAESLNGGRGAQAARPEGGGV